MCVCELERDDDFSPSSSFVERSEVSLSLLTQKNLHAHAAAAYGWGYAPPRVCTRWRRRHRAHQPSVRIHRYTHVGFFQCPTVSLARRRKMERKSVQKSWETLRSGARAVISPFSSSSFSTNRRCSVTKQFSSLVGPFYVFIQTKNEHTNCSRRAFTHTNTAHLAPLATNKNYRVWTLKHVNYHLRVDETTYRNKRDDHKEKKGRLFNINHASSLSSNYSWSNKERIRLWIKI